MIIIIVTHPTELTMHNSETSFLSFLECLLVVRSIAQQLHARNRVVVQVIGAFRKTFLFTMEILDGAMRSVNWVSVYRCDIYLTCLCTM